MTPSQPLPDAVKNAVISPLPVRLLLQDGHDIRFRKLTGSEGLSQTRVASAVQDNLGFMWFGTQYGLNRYDGYKFKVFKHEPGKTQSLSCVNVRSLMKDRKGALWVGCDSSVDKFDPITETFRHYPIYTHETVDSAGPVVHIYEDHFGSLWLATPTGLYRLEPLTGIVTRYKHESTKHSSLSSDFISFVAEDRQGDLWVANGSGLDAFDREQGRVTLHINLNGHERAFSFHEDRFNTFWIARASPSCPISTLDRKTNTVHCYVLYEDDQPSTTTAGVYSMLESRDGTMWFATAGAGMLKYDRSNTSLIRYKHHPEDSESIGSNQVVSLYEDREGDIWSCMHQVEPNFFAERPPAFQSFTQQRGSLAGSLVTTIFEDSDRILWIGSTGALNRIDRHTGQNTVPVGSAVKGEILSMIEDRSGTIVGGTYREGLQKVDRSTGLFTPYGRSRSEPSNQASNPIMRIMIDHTGTLWAATWGGLRRFDPSTGNFVTLGPDPHNSVDYSDIKEDSLGRLWLGGESGLQYYDPATNQFRVYKHDPDDSGTVSDNRVTSVYLAHSGQIWVGTQNGLDRFNETTGKFQTYYTADGLSGNVVSCILEDDRGQLWMGTNNGLSSLDPKTLTFRTYSSADGLPGQDLTGWSSCYKSASGEMFFGGFSGATAFYPSRIEDIAFIPTTVLTDFRLSGVEVAIGEKSPLKQSITFTDSLTLTSSQNIFSLEFAALSYFNSSTNHYRYKLEGLDRNWHYVDSSQRIASYTTLPTGKYTFRVQSATSRGRWSEPGVSLQIHILPPWWKTWWFIAICAAITILVLWCAYRYRLREIMRQHNLRLEERLSERNRIARELHDTLLQGFQGLVLRFQAVLISLPDGDIAHIKMEQALVQADQVLLEGRQSVRDLRDFPMTSADIPNLLMRCGEELAQNYKSVFSILVVGPLRHIDSTTCREIYHIGREAINNAFRHSGCAKVEGELTYGAANVCLRIRDDGKGIDPAILSEGREGHWGLPGMRERAKSIGAQLGILSNLGAGTEITLLVPLTIMKLKGSKESSWLRRV